MDAGYWRVIVSLFWLFSACGRPWDGSESWIDRNVWEVVEGVCVVILVVDGDGIMIRQVILMIGKVGSRMSRESKISETRQIGNIK